MDCIKVIFKDGRITTAIYYSSLGGFGWKTHTKAGEISYRIFEGLIAGKPFWIGRWFPSESNPDLKGCWATWESRLRVKELRFNNGAKYIFP